MHKIIAFSLRYKLAIMAFTILIVVAGVFALLRLPVGAVPDITNNQVQVITTTRNLSTEDVERYITYPVELEMANLPGVTEIRSVSKFGLSVVTVVFDDDIGTYLPRQLISEKLTSLSTSIPESYGQPFMGPISTGLGEIYQYTLDVAPGFEDQYTPMELRTIHDWVVKRQLSGIDGVVEVNTWGGYLKEFEVRIDPERLRTLKLPLEEVYQKVASSNAVAGGAYIERDGRSYFIKGEGQLEGPKDLELIAVSEIQGAPVLLRDVATITYGHAPRFGAITANGEGEKVLGQVMMLKGANSNEVINRVKKRVEEIGKSLPQGVVIKPFLDRSELIARTTNTVERNLIEGCLIVIFVVVLLLGNFRSGLIVASVIPLSLFFALFMMYIFGVDANLMSLGAIDFGIIIDGAVIIVEYTAYTLTRKKEEILSAPTSDRREKKDEVTLGSASKMMRSAIFGQFIILIVFLPILSMSGVEGKMFRPMALTFSFALIGAMILCLTYVPVASSLFLSERHAEGNKLSKRIVEVLDRMYVPVLRAALKRTGLIFFLALSMLGGSIWLFTTLGGEFVPTLDEGDFVIQPVLPSGTSLSETIRLTTLMEQRLIENFPEVDQVVSRIGAAEVPTDPMSMEESDVIIRLHPPSTWTTVETKEELADTMKSLLSEQLGLEMEFTQPIEMRFNELITGVRADVAIKVFGEDLEVLFNTASNIRELIADIDGAGDITLEKIDGTPSLVIEPRREALAAYGFTIDEFNSYVRAFVAGLPAGTIYQGERRFDISLRMGDVHTDPEALKDIYLTNASGTQVPLRTLAKVTVKESPARISRDDTHRRVVVGVNVRGRDVESVVGDIQDVLDRSLVLPAGYSISYGGQFENLRAAKGRLAVAVPVALALIFLLLYAAFKSVKEALFVFTAIPMAAIGGVLFLWLRSLPFSISAGVGFIALFGIAVLNGIVLIEHLNEMKRHEGEDFRSFIERGARERLRPVIITAAAAALGFLPMAISTSAGAEVQRPLATVVIGGLITSTLLTLVLLPVIYQRFARSSFKLPPEAKAMIIIPLIFIASQVQAQQELSLNEAVSLCLENHPAMQAANLGEASVEAGKPSSVQISMPEVYNAFDENNIAENGAPIRVWGAATTLSLPGARSGLRRQYEADLQSAALMKAITRQQLRALTIELYRAAAITHRRVDLYSRKDSLFTAFIVSLEKAIEAGETAEVDLMRYKQQVIEARAEKVKTESELTGIYRQLYLLTGLKDWEVSLSESLFTQETEIDVAEPRELYRSMLETDSIRALAGWQDEKQQYLPQLSLEGFQGTNNEPDAQRYAGYRIGVTIPLFPLEQTRSVKRARLAYEQTSFQNASARMSYEQHYTELRAQADAERSYLVSYEEDMLPGAANLLDAALLAFDLGEIDRFRLLQELNAAFEVEIGYLTHAESYNAIITSLLTLQP